MSKNLYIVTLSLVLAVSAVSLAQHSSNPGGTSPGTSGQGGNPAVPITPPQTPVIVSPAPNGPNPNYNVGNSSSPVTQQIAAPRVGTATQPYYTPTPGNAATPGDGTFDFFLATCVALNNQELIALGRLGQEKADSSDIREFADRIIADHDALLKKLQKFAPDETVPTLLNEVAEEAKTLENTPIQQGKIQAPEPRPGDRNAVQSAAAKELVKLPRRGDGELTQIQRELAAKCLDTSIRKLKDKEGADFDHHFISMMIAKQLALKDKLDVFSQHVSLALQRVLKAGSDLTEEHLATAEDLAMTRGLQTASTTNAKATSSERPAKAARKQ